jgi:nitrite reductase (NADH) small subunit
MAEIRIGALGDIPRGEGRVFRAGDLEVAVFRTEQNEVYATAPRCPHRGGPLADGLVGGDTVVCPLHDRVFDLKTGCGVSHDALKIATYPIRLSERGDLWLDSAAVPEPRAA